MKTVLEQERNKKGFSREQLAKAIGVTSEAVRLLETGKRKPSYGVLVRLLDLFGYKDPRELFAEVPDANQSQLENTTKNGGLKDGDYKRRNAGNDKCGSRAATGRAQQQ